MRHGLSLQDLKLVLPSAESVSQYTERMEVLKDSSSRQVLYDIQYVALAMQQAEHDTMKKQQCSRCKEEIKWF